MKQSAMPLNMPIAPTRSHPHQAVELHVTDTAAPGDAPDNSHRVTVTVTDGGRWRPRPVSPGFRGRGLQIMRALTDSVEVTATGTGTRVRMISRTVLIGVRRTGEVAQRLGDGAALLMLTHWLPGLC
jgi:hypothetical protein